MVTPKATTGVSLSLVCLGLLAVMPIISNGRPQGFSALGFAFYLSVWQTIFALPLFLFELRFGDRGIFSAGLDGRTVRRTALVAVATGSMFGLSTYLYVLGVERAGAASAAIALQAYPVFAIFWETLFLGRRKSTVELALTALLVAALCFLGTQGTGRVDGLSLWFLVALGVPFLWSIAHVIIKEEFSRVPVTPAQVTLFRVAVSTVFLAAVLAFVDPAGFLAGATRLDYQSFAMAMGLVYFLELIFWFHAVRHIDVSLASSITTPWPAFTMVLAVIVLGDDIEPYQVGAFVVVAASIYGLTLAGLQKSRRQSA